MRIWWRQKSVLKEIEGENDDLLKEEIMRQGQVKYEDETDEVSGSKEI